MTTIQLDIQKIEEGFSLKNRIYDSLKSAISAMNIYDQNAEFCFDERKLSQQFGISRTPLREALARLDQEGLIHIVPRRGVFIVRKSKGEILEMVTVWAALESMAARLITENATDGEIATLRQMFSTFDGKKVRARIDEYSDANIQFHQSILNLSKNKLLKQTADAFFMHVRAIRAATISDDDRADRSIVDHMHIIEALEERNTELAERRVREHTLNLRAHVEQKVNFNID